MDKLTKEKRSAIMRAIRSRDTLPELVVRKWLSAHGWRFRCQYRRVPGHPDIAIPKIRTLIEIRGCFWHLPQGREVAEGNFAIRNYLRDKRPALFHAWLGFPYALTEDLLDRLATLETFRFRRGSFENVTQHPEA